MAALEMLVHLGRGSILPAYVLIPCTFDDALVSRLDRKRLPKNWRSYPAPPELQFIGDEWVNRGASAVLEVPSAVIETDSHYLLNPRHPDFKAVRVMQVKEFRDDIKQVRLKAANGTIVVVSGRADIARAEDATLVMTLKTLHESFAGVIQKTIEAARRRGRPASDLLMGLPSLCMVK